MIGCDCAVCTSSDPRDRRDRPSVVVRYPRNGSSVSPAAPDQTTVLIDASPDLRHQSIRNRVNWLDALMLTHSHADHVLGLDDLRRFNSVTGLPLDVYAEPEVLRDLQRMFRYIFDSASNVNSSYIAQLIALPTGPGHVINVGDAKWLPIRLMHGRLPILGYRIDWCGRSIAYCTDCSSIPPETFPQLEGLDVLILDALRDRHHPTHLTIDQACAYAQQIGATRTYFTHIAHYHSHQELLDRLPEGIEPAFDGLTLTLSASELSIKVSQG